MRNEVASKYSRALFGLGKDHDNLVTLKENINEFWELVLENEDLNEVLFHQRITPEDKKGILKKLFAEEMNEDVLHFLFILIDKRREFFLESIIKEFNNLVDDAESILHVEVTSAVELNDSILDKLKEKLDSLLDYNIQIKNNVDEEIIAGIVLKIEDYIIDGSLRNELNSLKQKLQAIPVSKLGVN
ncbi:ATP synthase F1 subunit delta [Halanaerobium congolense]|jgi:F-type H+-transporting ATPase subunit delta|uniref:ATP synthase subunit delta n=1 Tax=Halanaerobium congolense TaxID=54121 RepID=A0A1G6J2S0_9FIRM|nr:ATP synthase F1 subunit delta [Halanaerobium congolense]KXS48674.1 MAG: F-type H+-transporting ATPase subunit delta [Halanaerobium sp. T82-1]PUU93289.1 MAG: F-type H+-transporting ATPase subunit delta [Halanaerobium sp.]PTX15815.1 ATP synthase F1 subcomplex delta subunit [Halanaerobium congolense]PXV70060.1 ATP synthase F1 subcomplex delta subunit [Halanaerobium congolense]TDP24175.1 ATP synthase F1 subcomplex delta subunit [Halanaerobium congolense]